MPIPSKLQSFTSEKIIFLCFLIFNLVNIWSAGVYVSLDGPSHLYNSSLLNFYDSSEFLQTYYTKNILLLPNTLSHLLLSKLFLVFDAITSEKILLSCVVVFVPLTFRYAVRVISGTTNKFSFIIFPLVFSGLLHVGFFNFYLVFIFLNLQMVLAHYILSNKYRWTVAILFVLNTVPLFFAHAFNFCLAMIVTFLYIAVYLKWQWKPVLKKSLYVFALCLPSLLAFLLFTLKIHVEYSGPDMKPYEKCSGFFLFSPGITFDIDEELPFSALTFLVLTVLTSYVITRRALSGEKIINSVTDLFLILALALLYLIFHSTDSLMGGMFIARCMLLIFYFLIFWLCCSLKYLKFMYWFALILVSFSYIKLSLFRSTVLEKASCEANYVIEAGKYIEEKTVVYVENYCPVWYEGHFSSYLGLNKEIVINDNYEAFLDWFPLKWKKRFYDMSPYLHDPNKKHIFPDYVFVYGNQLRLNETEHADLKNFVDSATVKIYESKDKFCSLYKRIKK